ncbi:uncharacterized protein LOC113214235 [Frankliniella occidentalis]|uniref:Uncharacterized protein LOC113214235 n=1 Tax=Frankliniella occidentalis TaxID=133901 RepID=A0A9C6WYR6_FRAOC|nr:uncharacterized protein LOC113214235 [Frankliniella occidentalis]
MGAPVRAAPALAACWAVLLCLLAPTAGTDLDVIEYVSEDGVMARALVGSLRTLVAAGAPDPPVARASTAKGSKKKVASWTPGNEVPLPEFPPPSIETIRAHFATPNGTVIVAQTAATATLPCVVRKPNLGAITWTRKTDYHLLTVGLTTYTVDQRFIVEHVRHQQAWNLQIRQATEGDAGLYECQITSHPPVSVFIVLKVIEARAEVVGAPDLHIKAGSSLRLVCMLRGSTETPAFLFWYRGTNMVNYDAHDGISVLTGEGAEEAAGAGAYSVLRLERAAQRHAGNYTCVPANARPASIQVHVINDEAPAAMQRGSGGKVLLSPLWVLLLSATLLATA